MSRQRLQTLNHADICDAAGVTYRQLDYWVRNGCFGDLCRHKGGTGRYREFDPAAIPLAKAIAIRTAYGWRHHNAETLRRTADTLRRWLESDAETVRISDDGSPAVGTPCLVIDRAVVVAG